LTGIEIHPSAIIGKGLFIDHGMGVVIGQTAVIRDNVTIFQGVTLGGTGKEKGKRHPNIEDNVVIGAGAKVLGNITIGANSYIGANAVVIRDVPENSTIVGVPGRVTKQAGKRIDISLDHVHVLDPIKQSMELLEKRLTDLEKNEDI
jgi:serine O-acetyltransferase